VAGCYRGISLLDEGLLASQDGVYSMELVSDDCDVRYFRTPCSKLHIMAWSPRCTNDDIAVRHCPTDCTIEGSVRNRS
jgi:hypothetical protein